MMMESERVKAHIERLLSAFSERVRYTFGSRVLYVGTTTQQSEMAPSLRDVDVLVVLSDLQESHIVPIWHIIRRLRAEFNVLLDVRLYSSRQLDEIPVVNQYLLKMFLDDLVGENPFRDFSIETATLKKEAEQRISETLSQITRVLPSIASNPEHVRTVAQLVYDAIRAYLVIIEKARATKASAAAYFATMMPQFPEAKTIYDAYVDPGSVLDIAEFITSCLALVKHLYYLTQPYTIANEVILINTPSRVMPHPKDDYLSYDHNMPLGLVCVASFLVANNIPTKIVDSYAENRGVLSTVDRLFADTETLPRLVGLNACSPNIHVAQQIARYIKRIKPDIVTVCGGPHPTLATENALAGDAFDYVVVGEGEEPMSALAKQLFAKQAVGSKSIPGVSYKRDDHVSGIKPKRLENLEQLPTPDFGLLPLERYFSVRRRLYIHTTRGCAFKCVYCSVPQQLTKGVLEFPVERVIENIKVYLERFAPQELQIVDDNFSHHKGKLIRSFCEALAKEHIEIRWKCQVRADQLDADLVKLMQKSGCFEIDLGVESGNTEIQRYIRKSLNLNVAEALVHEIAQAGVIGKAFFMLGFPPEEHSHIMDTINFAITLKCQGLNDVAFFPVMPFPGTEISKLTGKVVYQGAVIDESRGYQRSFAAHRLRKYSARPEVSLNSLFTPEELRLLVKFAYIRFESGQRVTDLRAEFGQFVDNEREELYAD